MTAQVWVEASALILTAGSLLGGIIYRQGRLADKVDGIAARLDRLEQLLLTAARPDGGQHARPRRKRYDGKPPQQ